MLIRKPDPILGSEITPETVYHNRRQFMTASAAGIASLALPSIAMGGLQEDDEITPENIVTQYNNFYEFGTDKSDPAAYAHEMTTDPWSVKVSGEANKTGTFAFEDIIKGFDIEERVYRFRCVEA